MKVLNILNEITFSGAEVMLKVAAPVLIRNGFDLHVLSTGDVVGKYAALLRDSGFTVHHIPFKKSPRYFIELYRFFRKERFDVVHIHPERAFFWHALVAWISGSRRIVRSAHSVFLFTGYLRLKRECQRFIARRVFKVVFIAISDSVAEIEKRHFKNTTFIVKNWVDESYFHPPTKSERLYARRKFGFNMNDVVVVSVGTCNALKNHRAILDAVAIVNRSVKAPIKYLHCGTGPTQENEKRYAKQTGLESVTTFIEPTDDIRLAYWASDIFVMTSRYEGLGNVILEAMSCGLPAVLFNVLGMRDTIPEGKGGFLVEPSPYALADAIKGLVLDGELRRMIGVEARSSVLRNFSMQESLERLSKLYRGERVA